MKRIIICFVLLLFVFPLINYASILNLGLFYGGKTVNDSDVRDVYELRHVYCPYFSFNIWKGIVIGAGYESGEWQGEIGLYQESTSLKITGVDLFVGYQFKIKNLYPYLKIGYGRFSYKQSIDSPYVGDYKVNHQKNSVTARMGLKAYFIKNFFLAGELKYVPLKVKPFDEEVDLGGISYVAGIGLTF